MRYCLFVVAAFLLARNGLSQTPKDGVRLIVLGTIQDAGSPHPGCKKDCCKSLFTTPDPSRKVVCLGLIDTMNRKKYLFEATPDMPLQMQLLKGYVPSGGKEVPDGIFLTHAHIGHYTGLMYLGKEAMDAKMVPVYVMPRMDSFLSNNGPWGQLVSRKNIELVPMADGQSIQVTGNISVLPFTVPHRDEYSETVGYVISGPTKKALFIPDIDKWERWGQDIAAAISKVDYAFVDATFYSGTELNNRDITQIPHPLIIESMEKLAQLAAAQKAKVHFIHFNHTNPVLRPDSKESREIIKKGFRIARFKDEFEL